MGNMSREKDKETSRSIGGTNQAINSKWTNLMVKAVEKGNPYCCFAFKYHWLKKHPSRKSSNVLFRAQGVCTKYQFRHTTTAILLLHSQSDQEIVEVEQFLINVAANNFPFTCIIIM